MSDCCTHADDAARWRRVESTIHRAADHGDLDAAELLALAEGDE